MEWTRRRVGPEGLVIVHNTMLPCTAIENFADYVVAMEWGYGMLSRGVPRPQDLPLEWSLVGARPQGVIGYGTIAGGAPGSIERQLALRCLLTGVAPWPAGEVALELFRPLKGVDLSGHRFFDWRASVFLGDNPSLMSAAYARSAGAIVLIANLAGERQACRGHLALDVLGLPPKVWCRIVSPAGAARSMLYEPTGEPLTVDVGADGLVWIEVSGA